MLGRRRDANVEVAEWVDDDWVEDACAIVDESEELRVSSGVIMSGLVMSGRKMLLWCRRREERRGTGERPA